MSEIPEGDWFCSPCHQDRLIRALQEKLIQLDQSLKELEEEKIREKAEKALKALQASPESINPTVDEESSQFEEKKNKNFFADEEPVGPRSCRVRKSITYTFEEYDRNINKAVGIPVRSQPESVPYVSRSMRNTRNNRVYMTESDASEEASGDEDKDGNRSEDSEFKVKTRARKFSDFSGEEEEEEEDFVGESDEDKDARRPVARKRGKFERNLFSLSLKKLNFIWVVIYGNFKVF